MEDSGGADGTLLAEKRPHSCHNDRRRKGDAPMKTRECSFVILLCALPPHLLGCSGSEEVGLDEAIRMGPFEFQVKKAFLAPLGRGHPQLIVDFEILEDESIAAVSFDDLMDNDVDADGNRLTAMFRPGYMGVVDSHGHYFVGMVKAGREQWWGEFIIWDAVIGRIGDQEVYDKVHRGLPVEDFTLVIKNPDPRKGQPLKVSIPLGEA